MLKKSYRLCKRGSFTYVYNKGERKSDKLLGLVWVRGKHLKIGFSVPNKVGKAVKRNKVKRRLRAVLRMLIPFVLPAQIVVTAKPGADGLTYREIETGVKTLLGRAKLLKDENRVLSKECYETEK